VTVAVWGVECFGILSVNSRSAQCKLTDTICIEHSQRTPSRQSGAVPFNLCIYRNLKDNLTVKLLQSPTLSRLKGSRFLLHSILERFQTLVGRCRRILPVAPCQAVRVDVLLALYSALFNIILLHMPLMPTAPVASRYLCKQACFCCR
jgi:hypothetical protein